MTAIRLLTVGAIALLAAVAVACGGDDDSPSDGGEVAGGGSGLIRPNTFMTYEGQRYELVNMIFEDMVPESEFHEAGVATQADIDMKGDMRVFKRDGDTTAVYTYSAPTADDVGIWLAWRVTS